jgi:hypothetical protein
MPNCEERTIQTGDAIAQFRRCRIVEQLTGHTGSWVRKDFCRGKDCNGASEGMTDGTRRVVVQILAQQLAAGSPLLESADAVCQQLASVGADPNIVSDAIVAGVESGGLSQSEAEQLARTHLPEELL